MQQHNAILESWNANADAWIKTIDGEEIESRKMVTNKAIIEAVLSVRPNKLLDIGCGEGWLSRSLRHTGIEVFGVDAVESLVQHAIKKDGPYYLTATYQELAMGRLIPSGHYDTAVINFALIDQEDTALLIRHLPHILKSSGYLVIQTLHPLNFAADDTYVSGWREGAWNGMKQDFVLPYKWYFRTLGDWTTLFITSGFDIKAMLEPLHPKTGKPASIIFILQTKQTNSL